MVTQYFVNFRYLLFFGFVSIFFPLVVFGGSPARITKKKWTKISRTQRERKRKNTTIIHETQDDEKKTSYHNNNKKSAMILSGQSNWLFLFFTHTLQILNLQRYPPVSIIQVLERKLENLGLNLNVHFSLNQSSGHNFFKIE